MNWLKGLRYHSWRLAGISISGLLVTIVAAGVIALAVNERVWNILAQAVEYDLDVEDHVDELWSAVLDLRHYHSNLVHGGPSAQRVENFEAAYQRLLAQISRYDQLRLEAPDLPQPDELRALARQYYSSFQPVIQLHATDWPVFEAASNNSFQLLDELESSVRRIENFGEQNVGEALQDAEAAANNARLLLIGKLVGHIVIGVGLAYLIFRILREQHQAGAELVQALQLKSDFMADISHELRTPLTVLRANAEVALDLERSCVHTELLEEIVRESAHMTRLVEDLLFLARSDAGALPLEWETVNLRPLLNELAERASNLASQQGITVRTELTAEGVVRIDPTRIVQAGLILIDNAAYYSAAGTTITLRSALRGREVLIEVADQGPGIPAEDLPLIFERFYRADKARTRKPGGAGLGLAIAKSIVTAHGGRMEAESVIQQGTKIRFYLPLVATPQAILPSAKPNPVGEMV